jgi:hypothetical protein
MLTVLVDDDRCFVAPRNEGEHVVARTSIAGLALLQSYREAGRVIEELWLDHDLGGEDTSMVIVDMLAEAAFNDDPYPVRRIYVHSMNRSGAEAMVRSLSNYGYAVTRATVKGTLAYVEPELRGRAVLDSLA